jgi:hypothetical protein
MIRRAQSPPVMRPTRPSKDHTQPTAHFSVAQLCTVLFLLSGLPLADGVHHMSRKAPRKIDRRKLDITPLLITNQCPENIWPGISTQSGTGPGQNGFLLEPGESRNQTVSEDWQGRVWGRTNCSFNDEGSASSSGRGRACTSGDCSGALNCQVGVSSTHIAHGICMMGKG